MAYFVNVTPRAEHDLALIYHKINAEESEAALKWYFGLKAAILSPGENPSRCPTASEHSNLRHLLYGNKPHVYRVIYRVVERHRRVEVLHIRHRARRRFNEV